MANKKDIGTQNTTLNNCPFHMPKENVKFFTQMQKAADAGRVCTFDNNYQLSRLTVKPEHNWRVRDIKKF